MSRGFTVDVENVAVGRELTMIAVGRAGDQQHIAAGRNRLPVVLDIVGNVSRDMRGGSFESHQLLDGIGNKTAISGELSPLVGVFGQDLARPSDQTGGRLAAGECDLHDAYEQLLPGK